MSSTNRGSDRDPLDRYPTPRHCVHRLLEALSLPGGLWVEPCAGAGNIIRAVAEVRSDVEWLANEIDTGYTYDLSLLPNVTGVSFEDARTLPLHELDASVIITNPPFALAEDILVNCLASSERGKKPAIVVLLQRLGWGGGPRAELFREFSPSIYQLPQRPSFKDVVSIGRDGKPRKSTQDSTEYGFFVFDGQGRYKMLAKTPDEIVKAEKVERRAAERAA